MPRILWAQLKIKRVEASFPGRKNAIIGLNYKNKKKQILNFITNLKKKTQLT